jgi:microcystin-dependent protein
MARVNFALPDLRGRTPIHVGSGHTLGERGGEQAAHPVDRRDADAHPRRERLVTNGNGRCQHANDQAEHCSRQPNQVYGPRRQPGRR